jgi:hypothetical protein
VFIVGAMGSGTTLLRLVLDSHEHIAIPVETGFMRAYDAHRFTPFKFSGRGWTKRLGWKPEELDEVLRELYDRLFMRYAERQGKPRWGDKTPLHTWHLEDMARVFPDAQFIGVIRHPCASVASNVRRFGLRMGRASTHWVRYTSEIVRNAALLGDRFALLRYEDLVLDPEPLLRELLDWLGEPWSDHVLDHHTVQARHRGWVEGKTRRDEAIDPARVDRWPGLLRPDQRSWLAERMGRHGTFFGYSCAETRPVASLAAHGRRIVLGTELAERTQDFPDLQLHLRPKPPVYDTPYDPHDVIVITREQFAQLTAPRGMRALGIRLVRPCPQPVRRLAVKVVRRTRAALGLRRRPRQI